MTTFSPTVASNDLDTPHQGPPPDLAGPFSHQLSPPNALGPLATSNPPSIAPRPSADFRHPPANGNMAGANGNGPMPVPGPHGRINGHGHGGNMRGMAFEGPRSPPNNKSTSHVPCKFYRQGACQAGKACPFLHSDEPLAERAPCKYFTKGNCKFGAKCALAHILPDGRIVNRNMIGNSGGNFNLGGRVNIPHHPEPAAGGSLLSMQAHMAPQIPPNYTYQLQDEYFGAQAQPKSQYDTIPNIEAHLSSQPNSHYGSPPNEPGRLAISPNNKVRTIGDVGLPSSFDSQGVSYIARYGPVAASVPSKLAHSPPASFQGDSSALRNLHNSAFGDDSRHHKNTVLASSPPESTEQPVGRRIMHSEMRRPRQMISSSVGARAPLALGDEWEDDNFTLEEDLVPNSLHDLLTPKELNEKMRRYSRDQGDNDGNPLSHRPSFSRLGASPTTSDLKVGSPSAATSSPSRFQSLWGRSRQPIDGAESGSLPGVSAFGHVGSPLRNSSLHPGASPSMRAMSRPTSGDASPFVSSPPRQTSMSLLSHQMQRTRLSSRPSDGPEGSGFGGPSALHPGMNRVTSTSSIGSAGGRLAMDRAVSSSSINRERIDEEQGLFSMEEEEEMGKGKDGASTTSSTSNKRFSGLSWGSGGKASPNLAPIGGHRPAGTSALGKDSIWGHP